MTRTEDRLTEALAARAAAVREDSLRPLVAGELGRLSPAWTGSDRRRRGWRAGLASLAAAAAMLLVVGGTIFAVRELQGTASTPFADVGTAHAPPPYYVSLDPNGILTVHQTATGRITDNVTLPERWLGGYAKRTSTLAASADGRTFVAAYQEPRAPFHTGLFKFSLSSSGRVLGLALIKGGQVRALEQVTLAVSPDGSRVAVAGVPDMTTAAVLGAPSASLRPPWIIVINTRTGQRAMWQGGMRRKGWRLGITDLSWASNGRSLIYLAQWCPHPRIPVAIGCAGSGGPSVQMREFSVASDGGRLGGRVLLRSSKQFPLILQARLSPDGTSAIALIQNGSLLSLVRLTAPGGRLIDVLYQARAHGAHGVPAAADLFVDGTGRYPIIDVPAIGWVHAGQLHSMTGSHYLPLSWLSGLAW